jgi:hypothetical protein
MIEIRVQKNGQKVIHFQTAAKSGESSKNRFKKTRKTGSAKNRKPSEMSSAKNESQMPATLYILARNQSRRLSKRKARMYGYLPMKYFCVNVSDTLKIPKCTRRVQNGTLHVWCTWRAFYPYRCHVHSKLRSLTGSRNPYICPKLIKIEKKRKKPKMSKTSKSGNAKKM